MLLVLGSEESYLDDLLVAEHGKVMAAQRQQILAENPLWEHYPGKFQQKEYKMRSSSVVKSSLRLRAAYRDRFVTPFCQFCVKLGVWEKFANCYAATTSEQLK